MKGRRRLVSVNALQRPLYFALGIGFADDRRILHILIIEARTKSGGKKAGDILLSEQASDRQRQFSIQVDVEKGDGETAGFGNFHSARQIEGKGQILAAELLQDIFHRERKHRIVFEDQDGKFRHSMTFSCRFIRPGMNI